MEGDSKGLKENAHSFPALLPPPALLWSGLLKWLPCGSVPEPGDTVGGRTLAASSIPSVEAIEFSECQSLQSGSNFPVIGKVTVTALSFVCSDT